ncbi:hypothetical protein DFP73DRAFT_635949 [Morchella snyderi]|nr:hypothetical protein DFP73DRAFT_635949 [Morchella snyderi]
MTLGCDIAAVLMRALDMLHHQTSPTQYALLTPDERKATLHQLAVTVDTAAKLAEVAHVDAVTAQRALASGTSRPDSGAIIDEIAAEIERFKVGFARIGRGEAEMVKTRAGEEGEEAGKVGEHVEGVVEETAGEEGDEAGKVGENVEGVVEETAGQDGEEVGKVGENVEGVVEETAGMGTEEVITVGEMEKAGAVIEAPGVVDRGGTVPETKRTGAVVPGRSGRSGAAVRRRGPLSQRLSDVEKVVEEMEREREERERD